MRLIGILAVLAGLTAGPDARVASAGEPEPKVLERVLVTATAEERAPAETVDRSAFVTTVDPEPYQERVSSLAEVMEQSTGVTVRRFGGLGAFSTASIRGSSAQQVTVLLDGVPLNRASSGAVNLSNVPLESVERIEVYRGSAPLRFRSSSIGGVINIVTKEAQGGFAHQGAASYGSFDTYTLNALTTGRAGKWGYTLAADAQGSDGDFEFDDDNGTPLNPTDDRSTKRKNNDFDSQNFLVKGSYSFSPSARTELANDYFQKEEGVPGTGSNQSTRARLDTRRNVLHSRTAVQGLLDGVVDTELLLHLSDEITRFEDPEGEIGIGRQRNRNETLAWGVDSYSSYFWGEHQILSLLGAFAWEDFDGKNRVDGAESRSDRKTYQIGMEDEIYLFEDRLTLTPQVLYTYLDNDFGKLDSFFAETVTSPDHDGYVSYKGGVRFQVIPSLHLKANFGRQYRYPTFSELFGDRGTIIGNPGLDPEEAYVADAGMTFHRDAGDGALPPAIDRMYLEAAVFWVDARDLIAFEQTGQNVVRADNISRAEIRGLEIAWGFDFWKHVSLSGNYTYQDAENTGDDRSVKGNQLPGRPEDELFHRLEFYNRLGRVFHEFVYMADNYLDTANIRKVNERKIHNLGISAKFYDHATLTLEARNVTDEQISDVVGFPLPGRSYFATLRVTY